MTNLTTLPDEKLNKLAATEVMGWSAIYAYARHIYTDNPENSRQPNALIDVASWNPCQNAEQAMMLAEKFAFGVYPQTNSVHAHNPPEVWVANTWQRAVVIAAILSVRGEL